MAIIDKVNLNGTDYDISPAPILLENGVDFDNTKTPGNYIIGNVVNSAYTNCPFTSGSGTLMVLKSGAYGQLHQIATVCNKANPQTYERFYYESSWGEWVNTSNFEGTLLWSGQNYMHAEQSINLSKPVSAHEHGIVLVFSTFDSSTATADDANFCSFFVPKRVVTAKSGAGHTFNMNTVTFASIATKVLYIKDNVITGHTNNTGSGSNNGVTYNNSKYVLRYVIGV